MSFRKKILFSQLLLFAIFLAVLFPLIEKTVQKLVRDSLEESTTDLVDLVKESRTEEEMISSLQNQELAVFFRITLLNAEGELIYDSQRGRLGGEAPASFDAAEYPEIAEAMKEGTGYSIGQSKNFKGKFVYVAKRFPSQGKSYILRTTFPFGQIQDITKNFEVGFLIFSLVALLFFMGLTLLLFNRFSRPIKKIIDAVRPYQLGQREDIPLIALENGKGEFDQLAKTLNSLSERIQSQIRSITQERNEKEAILESLGEGVIAVDDKMNVTYVNYMASKMLALSKKELLYHPLSGSAHMILGKCSHLLKDAQEQHKILTDSLSYGTEKKIYLDLIAAPKARGSGAIIVLQDVSSHYKVLDVGKAFVANASHELRTPITIIKGFAETLQDLPEMPKEMLSEVIKKILRNCERMEMLIKNLLRLSDLENLSEEKFRECNLVALVQDCKQVLTSLNPETQITLIKSEDEIEIYADPDVLELAIINILNNAVKYSKPPAQIKIEISILNEDEVELAISDQGIGIAPVDLEHIFDRFYTVDKTHSRKMGGAGLGLSIVKTIVDKHGGTIRATSALGKGTTFTLVLPRKSFHRG